MREFKPLPSSARAEAAKRRTINLSNILGLRHLPQLRLDIEDEETKPVAVDQEPSASGLRKFTTFSISGS